MSKFDPVRTCVCCGARMRDDLSRQELVAMGCTLQMEDGSVVFRCLHHSDLECLKMIGAIPSFCRASELRRH